MKPPQKKYSVLLTDLYQLTMAYGYWKNGVHEREAVFHLFFRKNPFHSGFSVACGLADAIDYIETFAFDHDELAYLASLTGNDGQRLFEDGFLEYLRDLRFTCDIDAIPEGTLVFSARAAGAGEGAHFAVPDSRDGVAQHRQFSNADCHEGGAHLPRRRAGAGAGIRPATRPRHRWRDGGQPRRAMSAVARRLRMSLAGMRYGIPVKGTHAHSWVMSFETEEEAFEAYAQAMPNNCVFLVDTYDTLEGVRTAVRVAGRLREKGHELAGIRLDSGDLAYLSIEARKILDEGGFPKAVIIASNDLDEQIITSIKQQGGKVGIWGVGTKLVTAFDQPAMGGVYKLAAVREAGGDWRYSIKLSEQPIKVSNPASSRCGVSSWGGEFIGDMIYNEGSPMKSERVIVDPVNMSRSKKIPVEATTEDLLVPIFKSGKLIYDAPKVDVVRLRTLAQLEVFTRASNVSSIRMSIRSGLRPVCTS